MASKLFKTLIEEKIEFMKFSMMRTSKDLFWDEKAKKLTHPGEYGTYRESIVKDFLRLIVPGRLDIGSGFLINSNDEVSTQCDLVIYDRNNTPLIENGERQRFFPVETVCGIVEIKSTLGKKELSIAINKLARNKSMREKLGETAFIKREHPGNFDPENYAYDHIFSVIICLKFDFDTTNLAAEIDAMYDSDIKPWQRHNLILSLNDGLLAYKDISLKTLMYPYFRRSPIKNRFIYPDGGTDVHIYMAAAYIFLGISSASIYYIDVASYLMGLMGKGFNSDQN